MDESNLEQRLRGIEGRQLAIQAALKALLLHRFRDERDAAEREGWSTHQAIEDLYATHSIDAHGDEVVQVALHTIDQLYEGLG